MTESKPRVLVAEDDPAIRHLLTEAFEEEGYEVRAAENGLAALDAVRRCPPSVIVLDLMMPVMDGWEFRARQLELDAAADVPVVVLSAANDLPRQGRMLGAAAVIEKPFELEAVLSTVESLAG
jgi:CheY-like chemotaxis protein